MLWASLVGASDLFYELPREGFITNILSAYKTTDSNSWPVRAGTCALATVAALRGAYACRPAHSRTGAAWWRWSAATGRTRR